MATPLFAPLRRLACFVMINMLVAQAALAAPASKESLQKYFDVKDVPSLVPRSVEAVGAAKSREWQEETDPAIKAEKKAQFEKLDAIIRKYITWKALEPVAIDSYQRRLEESDVRALIAHAESPSGQVAIKKLAPALLEVLPQIFGYINQRVEEIGERKQGAPVPLRPAIAAPAPGSKEALAITLLTEMPGAREEFKHRMAGMETAMLKAAETFGAGNADVIATVKLSAARLQAEISFEETVSLQAKLLADKLTEEEFKMLINEHRQPALKQLLAKQQLAEREFSEGANQFMTESIMPGLMGEMMEVLMPATSKTSAPGSAKSAQKKAQTKAQTK